MDLTDKVAKHFDLKDENKSLYPSYKGKSMIIEITNKCNQKCIFCTYSVRGIHDEGKFIDEELFYRLAKEGRDMGIEDFGIYISGEPLMNPKVYDYIRYLKKELGGTEIGDRLRNTTLSQC